MLKRDVTIDIVKAIGILLMILGHCPGITHIGRNFIFSFHMPLFFIFSGYFYKSKALYNVFRSGNKHLVRPYIITSFFCILFSIYDWNLVKEKAIAVVMSNGGWPSEMFGSNLPFVGPIWFLLALYWCKIFYCYLKKKTDKCLIYSFIISTVALIIGKYIVNLPLGILTGFCGMVFYCIGDYWRNKWKEQIKTPYFIIGLFVWALCILKGSFDLSSFNCSFYPISMFAAFIGTYVIYLFAKRIPRFMYPKLIWIGQNTLLILCYHTFAFLIMYNLERFLFIPNNFTLPSVLFIIIIFVLSLGLPYLHTTIYTQLTKRVETV